MAAGPFSLATGEGVRIAVIDSGVNAGHPHIAGVAGGVGIPPGGVPAADFVDVMGHGTAVMAAIQEKAPAASCYAVKVFHSSLRTSILQLTEAMGWAIDQQIHIINLSLGTRNAAHIERFRPLLERAANAGVLVVSALEADGETCYPGALPGVVGVAVEADGDRDAYVAVETAQGWVFRASPYPRSLPGVPKERNLSGISFAVANMTGFVARAREHVGLEAPLETVRAALVAQACARVTRPEAP